MAACVRHQGILEAWRATAGDVADGLLNATDPSSGIPRPFPRFSHFNGMVHRRDSRIVRTSAGASRCLCGFGFQPTEFYLSIDKPGRKIRARGPSHGKKDEGAFHIRLSHNRRVGHPSCFPLRGRWEQFRFRRPASPFPSLGFFCKTSLGMQPWHCILQTKRPPETIRRRKSGAITNLALIHIETGVS